MTLQNQQIAPLGTATYWAIKPLTDSELTHSKIGAVAPDVPVPAEGYFKLSDILVPGIVVRVPLSKGIVKNDTLLFAMSSDGALLYTVVHYINLNDYNAPVELHIPGEAFSFALGRTVHFAYNIQRANTIVMVSPSVDVPVRA